MTLYDHLVIAFYFAFMLGLGWLMSRFVRSASDYFRGGGQMLWWLIGCAAFMTQFSAWTFTGAASMAYDEGWPVLVIYLGNAIGFLCNYLYFAARARRMRVITAIEGVRQRFGRGNEQFFTWLQIPMGTLYAGIWLNGLCVFLSAAFGFDLTTTIVVTGFVVVVMTLLGGSWAAVAGDFIQTLVLMPVTIVAALLALHSVGGVGGFVESLPAGHLDLSRVFSSNFLLLWVGAMVVKQFISTNSLFEGAPRYLCAKDDRQARRAALVAAFLFIVGPLVWFVPPMVSRAAVPDIGAMFPNLPHPSEAAFVAICVKTMPAGMIGLLISGMFSATMSTMDSGLNRNAGIFVKNFYQVVLRPGASDQELVRAGKITTIVMGLLAIAAGLTYTRLENLKLFDLMVQFGTLVGVPYAMPLVLGLIFTRTPPWSGWTTVALGFATSLLVKAFFTPEWAQGAFGLEHPLSRLDASYWTVAAGLILNVFVCVPWFISTTFFWKKASPEAHRSVEDFRMRIRTPVDYEREIGNGTDHQQARTLGLLSCCYGIFVLLLALIPNPWHGRLGFVFCGGVMLLVGGVLVRAANRGFASATLLADKVTTT